MASAAGRTVSMCPGPVSRRSFLEVGSLGAGMLGLSDILRLNVARGVIEFNAGRL